jgi:hypothetical protein
MLAIGRRDNGAHGWGWVIWWVEFSCDGWNCNQFLGCVFGVSGKTIETPVKLSLIEGFGIKALVSWCQSAKDL